MVDAEARTVAAATSSSMCGAVTGASTTAVHVLRGVAVAAARARAEHAAGRPAGHQLGQAVPVHRADHPRARRRGPAPAGQQPPDPAETAAHHSPAANMASQISSQ